MPRLELSTPVIVIKLIELNKSGNCLQELTGELLYELYVCISQEK